MTTVIYMVTAQLPASWNDGRSTEFLWGHERQYHASLDSAEAACNRLRAGSGSGLPEPAAYGVKERTRSDYPADFFGEEEWRAACYQAGIDPSNGAVVGARSAWALR
jgi:hypothetical protein